MTDYRINFECNAVVEGGTQIQAIRILLSQLPSAIVAIKLKDVYPMKEEDE